ncbi:HNH nuclease domain-containing protein [Madurella fahalii]|uniref:HNH nuclease domain-containing protein n=1 Tax=Madurella fahalii TaxID=1157608 RepID=A0ABQ0GNF3_9PEZI
MISINNSDIAADKQHRASQNKKLAISGQPPASTLNLYRRLAFGRKHLFGHDDPDQTAEYFVVNPVPQKHRDSWRPVFYRGDNPKYSGLSTSNNSSRPVARALRAGMWNSFQIQIGDGVSEVLENEAHIKKRKKRKKHERKQKARRFFRIPEKPLPDPIEEPREVQGLVAIFKMRRSAFLRRTLKWELGGYECQWKGTRRFLTGPFKNLKGVSHDFKLVDANNNIIATFEKDRWASYKKSERLGYPPNKKRLFLGKLRRYPAADAPSAAAVLENIRLSSPQDASGFSEKLTRDLNLQGPQSGDITEEAIAFTCWIAVEAEHRLRYKIFDLIEEIVEGLGE